MEPEQPLCGEADIATKRSHREEDPPGAHGLMVSGDEPAIDYTAIEGIDMSHGLVSH
jgi:hypothetical protein